MSKPTPFVMSRDNNGYVAYGLQNTSDKVGVLLGVGAAQSFTVPKGADQYECIFSIDPGLRVFVDTTGATATAFSSTIGTVTAELNPTTRVLAGGTTVSMITPDANAYVGVIMYAKQ